MQSGTKLHLALLKKISARRPEHKLGNRDQQSCSTYSYYSARTPSPASTSRSLISKDSNGQRIPFFRKKSKSLDQPNQIQDSDHFQVLNSQLSGWDIQNEEDLYQAAFKCNHFSLCKKQQMKTKRVIQPGSSNTKDQFLRTAFRFLFQVNQFTEQEIKIVFDHPKKQRSKKLKSIVLNVVTSRQYPIQNKNSSQKQNTLGEYFVPRTSVRSRRQNFKGRIQRLNDYAKEFGDQLLRKRIC